MMRPGLPLAVALAESGHLSLAAQLDGYVRRHSVSEPATNPHDSWMWTRLATLADAYGTAEWETASEQGSRLDRRGFMRLLAEAEQIGADGTPDRP